MSIENCKLKQYCDISPYVLDWPKSMIWTTSNAGEDVEKQKLLSIAVWNEKGCSCSGRQTDTLQNLQHLYHSI